jgi:hypothetical protein
MARVGHGTGDLWKIFGTFPDFAGTFFGFLNFDRKIFGIFNFRPEKFSNFKISSRKFFRPGTFNPKNFAR